MIEYAVTAGEGILLAYGVTDDLAWVEETGPHLGGETYGGLEPYDSFPGATLIARPCTPDCETGK